MKIKELSHEKIIIKQSSIFSLIIGFILVVVGLIVLIMKLSSFDASDFSSYIGLLLMGIGAIFVFTWKSKTTIVDKNENYISIEYKKITNKQEKKSPLNEVKEVAYRETLRRSRNSKTGGSSVSATKIVEVAFNSGEVFQIYNFSGNYNPFMNKTKSSAQRLADFIGVPFKPYSLGDTLKDVGSAILGKINNNNNNNNQGNI